MSWLCRLGWHRWAREPFQKAFIRSTGLHVLFSSSGIQLARRRCERCPAEQDVCRTGMVGWGKGTSTKWRPVSARRKAEIENEYPVL